MYYNLEDEIFLVLIISKNIRKYNLDTFGISSYQMKCKRCCKRLADKIWMNVYYAMTYFSVALKK